MKRLLIPAAAMAALMAPATALAQIDTTMAERFFAEATAACEADANADGGALWGVSLCGPMMLVNPRTREVVADQAGRSGFLTPSGALHAGVLAPAIPLANTAVEIDGVRWTMVLLPLPDDVQARRALMMHEAWHRIQPELGLPMASPVPAHLATPEGRVAMRLEWRALGAALIAADALSLRTAIADALTFRAARHMQAGADGAEQERQLEMNEGLAEYTGLKLSGAADPAREAAQALRMADQADSFPRIFAYASGPAYGLLLDELSPGWRTGLAADADLGALLAAVIDFEAPDGDISGPVQVSAARYGGEAIATEEVAQASGRESQSAAYVARLVDGPTLTVPFQPAMRISFDPNTVTPLPPHGVVYPTATITDAWGVLTVTNGALVHDTFRSAAVPAPASATTLSGDGWTLTLNSGWRIVPGNRPGDFRVVAE
jgi:hypothetical protein